MTQRVVVDPITRIEGHLRIEAQMDAENKTIAAAYSSGTMVQGIEIILRGRDPRDAWAFAQRICGICTLVHGMASIRAVENALASNQFKNPCHLSGLEQRSNRDTFVVVRFAGSSQSPNDLAPSTLLSVPVKKSATHLLPNPKKNNKLSKQKALKYALARINCSDSTNTQVTHAEVNENEAMLF